MKAINKRLWRKNSAFRKRHSKAVSSFQKSRWQDPEYRKRMSEIARARMKRRWKNNRVEMIRKMRSDEYRYNCRTSKIRSGQRWHPSLGAVRLKKWLGRDWLLEYYVVINYLRRYAIDVANPKLKIAYEVDGKSHSKPRQKVRDRQRDKDLHSVGWKVIRLSENDCRLLGRI